jgi:uncharacterized DUF497 family protein
VNATPYRPSAHLGTTLKSCRPERSLAESEANRQTQSKDPYHRNTARGNEKNFRVVVRFFNEHEAELRPVSSREAAAWEIPTRQCRVCEGRGTSPAGTALSNKRITQ